MWTIYQPRSPDTGLSLPRFLWRLQPSSFWFRLQLAVFVLYSYYACSACSSHNYYTPNLPFPQAATIPVLTVLIQLPSLFLCSSCCCYPCFACSSCSCYPCFLVPHAPTIPVPCSSCSCHHCFAHSSCSYHPCSACSSRSYCIIPIMPVPHTATIPVLSVLYAAHVPVLHAPHAATHLFLPVPLDATIPVLPVPQAAAVHTSLLCMFLMQMLYVLYHVPSLFCIFIV